ncbi:MAG: glycoside hydrolase family 130 protein [Phycisphaerae bacterium]
MQVPVTRLSEELSADDTRVISRPFIPGGEGRVAAIISRVLALGEAAAALQLRAVMERYAARHKGVEQVFERHFDQVRDRIANAGTISVAKRRLMGAYFTMEYSLESVALFNPSMVFHPDQSGLAAGEARFIVSLRACGEGHVSSIEFREGLLDAAGEVHLAPMSRFVVTEAPREQRRIDKNVFYLKLVEMGVYDTLADRVLSRLEEYFTLSDLEDVVEALHWTHNFVERFHHLAEMMLWLARSSYQVKFPEDSAISERVIFPVTENESRGIEDARFVRFESEDGATTYYATYTAYNGVRALSQMIATDDFRTFSMHTLNGACVQNKGMALFPRKINDRYVMLARLDGENIFLLRSESLFFWNESQPLCGPQLPWEFVQVGNCGSPIETSQGWLVLTHGVGPMREYRIGAMLLDLDKPDRIIGAMREPLLIPLPEERDGYVPNVVYSCGGVIHNGRLVLPYAVADSSTRFATVAVDDLLTALG